MGTIEDKLKYLAKTKVDLMNALKAKGAPIDESTPLSEYDVMVKAIKGGGAGTEVFSSIEEMKAATVSPGTVCKIVKKGTIKVPLTEATSIKSILLNNVIEMAKSSTSTTETRWESADGSEYFAIYRASGITGSLFPNRKMIKYYSAVDNEGFEIAYNHDGNAYTTTSLNAPYLIEFSKPLTLVTSINHSDIAALIYSTTPAEVLTNIFEYKDNEYKELIGTPKPYESIEDMEADAIAPEVTAVVYDKSSNTFMGVYETTELGWKVLSGQLTATANTIAPGFVGYGPDGVVNGTFTSDATAVASDILEGQTAYVNGKKVIGSIQSTYTTTDGVASPLYENAWTGNTSYRTMAFSHKFGVALLRTTTTQKTESLRIAKVNKETGTYSIASSSYDITSDMLIGYTSYSFVGADIAQQLNEDGTLRMVFALSTLSTDVYSRDGYIVACDYDLSTYTIKKIYKPSFGSVNLDYFSRANNATPVYFSPTNKDVFLVLDTISNDASSSKKYDIPGWLTNYALALCFIQPSGDILFRSCLRDGNSGNQAKSQRIAWSPNGTRIWWNSSGLYPSTYDSDSSSICEINYDSASVKTTIFKNAGYGHMVFLNENTLFELRYDKAYNIYSTDGKSITKVKSGTIDMTIYYKTGSSYYDDNITELRCVDNNIFYVDSQNFYCITLDDEYNVSKVQALDSKYCCLIDVQTASPYLNRKCLVTKVEDGKYIHCSDANMYYAVFQITGDKVIETINKDGVTLHNLSNTTATSNNIEEELTAYINGGKVTGTLEVIGNMDVMVTSDNLTVGNQRGWDCVSVKFKNTAKRIFKANWFVDQHIKYEQLAEKLEVTPDKVAAGKTILGVSGTGSNTLANMIYSFPTLEEAQEFGGYKVNDLAMVKKLGWRPMYPIERVATGPNSKMTKTAYSTFRNNMSDLLIRPKQTVTLKEPITGTFSKIIEGDKSTAEVSVDITSTTCKVVIYDAATLSTKYCVNYTSTDGLTYTNTSADNLFVNSNGELLDKYGYVDYTLDIWGDVISDWDNMKIISEFIEEGQEYHIEQVLQYLPTWSTSKLTSDELYYTYDLDTVRYDSISNLPCAELVSEGINLTPYVDFAATKGIIEMGGGNTTLHGVIIFKNGDVGYFTDLGVVFDGTGNGYVYSHMDNEYYNGKGYIGNIENNTLTTYDKTNYPTVTFTYPESSSNSPSPMRKICDLSEAKAIFEFNGSGTTTTMSYIEANMPLIVYTPDITATTVSLDTYALRPASVWYHPELIPLNSDFM